MHRITKLLCRRIVRIVSAKVRIVGLVAVGTPMALVLAGIGIKNDYAMVGVTIGDVNLIGLLVDKRFRREPEIFNVVAAFAVIGFANLHQELPILCKLQDHVVVIGCGRGGSTSFIRSGGRRPASVSANPNVAFI